MRLCRKNVIIMARTEQGCVMNYIDGIISIGKTNGGYVACKDVVKKGIPSIYLSRLLKQGTLRSLARGVYILFDYPEDEIYTISLCYARAVFSRRSALYLNGIVNRQLEQIEANFPLNYNVSNIQRLQTYRTNKEQYELGQALVKTPLGHEVKSYNIERCICDLFYYDDFDIEDKSYAIKAVDKSKIDYDKLFSYAKTMKVLPQVKSVFEVI